MISPDLTLNRQNGLRFVHTHFKSCDQSLDKTPFDFTTTLRTMQSCAMNTKSRIILKLPKSLVKRLEMGKANLSRLGLFILEPFETIFGPWNPYPFTSRLETEFTMYWYSFDPLNSYYGSRASTLLRNRVKRLICSTYVTDPKQSCTGAV